MKLFLNIFFRENWISCVVRNTGKMRNFLVSAR